MSQINFFKTKIFDAQMVKESEQKNTFVFFSKRNKTAKKSNLIFNCKQRLE